MIGNVSRHVHWIVLGLERLNEQALRDFSDRGGILERATTNAHFDHFGIAAGREKAEGNASHGLALRPFSKPSESSFCTKP